LGDKKSWAFRLTDFLDTLVTKWKGEEAGSRRWGGRAAYVARLAGTEEMMMMMMMMLLLLQQETDLKKWDLNKIDFIVLWNSAGAVARVRDSFMGMLCTRVVQYAFVEILQL
jgi:hypothetical protein